LKLSKTYGPRRGGDPIGQITDAAYGARRGKLPSKYVAHHWAASHPFAVRVDPPSIESMQLSQGEKLPWSRLAKEVGDIREIKIPNFINLEYRDEFASQLLAISRSMDQTLETCAPAHVQRRLTWITGRVPALPALL
jgi:hypothetical protein